MRRRPEAVPVVPAGEATCPDDLSDAAKLVWAELAPHARAEGTLTERTASAFADLCRCVVWANDLAASVETRGRTDHRGLMRQVEMLKVRFRLIPDGKPVQVAEPKDEWQEFDAPLKVVGGNG